MAIAFLFFLIVTVVLVFQVVGSLIHRLWNTGASHGLFGKIFSDQVVGALAVIVLYSLVITQGKTLFVLLFLPVIYLIRVRREDVESPPILGKESGNWWKVMVIVLALVLSFSYFLFMYSNGVHDDLIYYADISYYLNIYKQEKINIGVNVFEGTVLGCSPYHYVELWMNALLNWLSPASPIDHLVLVTFPYGLFLVFLGLLALSEQAKEGGQIPLFACIGVFVFGLVPDFLIRVPGFQAINYLIFYPMNLASIKALPICIGVLYFFWKLRGKDLTRSSLGYLSFLPFLSITTLPVIYGGSMVFAIYQWIRGKREYRFTLGYFAVLLIGMAGFYYLTSVTLGENQSAKIEVDFHLFSWLKNFFKVLLGIPALMIVAYGGYIFLLVWNRKSLAAWKNLWLFLVIIMGVGLASWGALYLNLNTSQLFTVTNLAFFHVCLFYFILQISPMGNRLAMGVLGCMTLANAFIFLQSTQYFQSTQSHQKKMDFVNRIKTKLSSPLEKDFRVAYLKNPVFYGSNFEEGVGAARGSYLHFIRSDIQLLGLNEPLAQPSENIYDRKIQVFLLNQHPFYRWFNQQNVPIQTLGSYQLMFMKTHHIHYLYLEKGVAVPNAFLGELKDSLVDSHSGDKFFVLKNVDQ